MPLNLAHLDYKKYTWISQLSLLFALHDGYLNRDNGDEIDITLNCVYDTQVRFLVRNHQFDDVDNLYATTTNDKYNFLSEIIEGVPGLKVSTIINLGAGIGVAAIYLAKIFGDAAIKAFESDELDFAQLQKNLTLNAPASRTIDAYSQCDDAMHEIKALDLLVCSPRTINQFLLGSKLMKLIAIARVIVVDSFLSNDDQNSFLEYISPLNFSHGYFEQTMVCWKH